MDEEEEGEFRMEKERITFFANKENLFVGKKNYNMSRKVTARFHNKVEGVASPPNKHLSIKKFKKQG
jgi:hypothetical protein